MASFSQNVARPKTRTYTQYTQISDKQREEIQQRMAALEAQITKEKEAAEELLRRQRAEFEEKLEALKIKAATEDPEEEASSRAATPQPITER